MSMDEFIAKMKEDYELQEKIEICEEKEDLVRVAEEYGVPKEEVEKYLEEHPLDNDAE